MATSTWLTVATAVRDALAALPGYRDAGEPVEGTTVYLLTSILTTEERGDWVCVGWPGEPDTPSSPGRVDQRPGPLAAAAGRPRDETGTVAVRLCAQDGDRDPGSTALRALTLLADLETLCRADPTFGIAARRMVVQMTSAELLPSLNRGTVHPIDVALTFTARI